MVFQNYALYPHMTVAENMGVPADVWPGARRTRSRRRSPTPRRDPRPEGHLDRKPRALSGGQRQRVAMGRAIVREPPRSCMDEPLSNLDAKLRVQTRTEIARCSAAWVSPPSTSPTTRTEAMTMGDRVAVLSAAGVLQQCRHAARALRAAGERCSSPGSSGRRR
jgi:multiple sugar transport system ATP-binding protein